MEKEWKQWLTIFMSSEITGNSDCSHEIKRRLPLGRKAMTSLAAAAAAAAKSLQSCPTLHNSMGCSLPGSSIHGIFQARVLEWGAIAFSNDQLRQHIKKQRHYFAYKGPSSQSYDFPNSHVWMWELDYKETWAPKSWCFELWCWRRLLRVPWTARRSNHSILEISPKYSLEGLMLKLKLQYLGHLMWRAESLEKTLMLGKIEDRRKRGWLRMRWL